MKNILVLLSVFAIGCGNDAMRMIGFSEVSKQAIKEAVDEWCEKTAGASCGHFEQNASYVIFKSTIEALGGKPGICRKEDMYLATIDDLDRDRALALHELGHHYVQNWAKEKCQDHPNARVREDGTIEVGVMIQGLEQSPVHLTELDLEWYCANKGCHLTEGKVVW